MAESRTTWVEKQSFRVSRTGETVRLFRLRRSGRAVLAALALVLGLSPTAEADTAGRLTFSWRDNSENECGFRIERSTDGATFTRIAAVAPGVTRYEDGTVAAGRRYWYRVAAYNIGGLSPYSPVVEGMVPLPAINTAPTIDTAFVNHTVAQGAPIPLITFGIGDAEVPATELTLIANSSNGDLVPVENLRFGGTGAQRTLTITPRANRSGWTTIWVKVSDGVLDTVSSFVLVVTTPDPTAPSASLLNLSARGLSRPDDPLTVGFVVAGGGHKRVLLRAIGPTLAAEPFGVSAALANPRLALLRWTGAAYVGHAANADWGTGPEREVIAATASRLFAFGLAPTSLDAAVLTDVPSGQFTALAEDETGEAGVALVELYDADGATDTRFINVSTRGYVGAGSEVLIAGFVVAGEGTATVLLRAVGPGLAGAPFHVPGVLADPEIRLYRQEANGGSVEILWQNDWWAEPTAEETAGVAADVGAFALAEGSRDAAVVVTLGPGVYTAVVRGLDGATGTALAEIYQVR